MSLFLRFTEFPEQDLERGYSYHMTDFGSVDEALECHPELSFEKVEGGNICQILKGLCGFELESETLGEALEEIENWDTYLNTKRVSHSIWEVVMTDEYVPDGHNFYPKEILYFKKIEWNSLQNL